MMYSPDLSFSCTHLMLIVYDLCVNKTNKKHLGILSTNYFHGFQNMIFKAI